ncbi:hypothetical protein AVEN_2314-1 [Araneus ventricosus]|uniref:Uncharacterized protein n=1 Tax=Araneus ventricosus TaxID=182803 RepID=A0A4Y2N715_ARAVE|nr:hypothetical protein AVEN_2314-1 [Araneus ventricosus]
MRNHCKFFKSEKAIAPINFLAYMQVPPRHIILKNIKDDSLLDYLLDEVTPQLIETIKDKREERNQKVQQKTNTAEDISTIMTLIRRKTAQSEAQLISLYNKSEFLDDFTKRTFSVNFKKALELEMQSCLDRSILKLIHDYQDLKNDCLTPEESADIISQWCLFQTTDAHQFTLHVLELMDNIHKK